MKKILIVSIISLLLVSCGTKTSEINTKNNLENKPQIKTVLKAETAEEKYGTLGKFIKKDLSKEDDIKLKKILEERKARVQEIKEILIKAKRLGVFEEEMKKVEAMREICKNRILPYVSEEQVEKFKKTCDSGNDTLRNTFQNK